MRRTLLLLSTMALMLPALTAGVALAVDFNEVSCPTELNTNECYGTPNPDKITGTNGFDQIYGLGGGDQILGGSDFDVIKGGRGNDHISDTNPFFDIDSDQVFGNRGNDTVNVKEGEHGIDYVYCGPGKDTVFYDDQFSEAANDKVYGCEIKNPQP